MMLLTEFIERLERGRNNQWNDSESDNEIDKQKYRDLQKILDIEINQKKQYHPTFWNLKNDIYDEKIA